MQALLSKPEPGEPLSLYLSVTEVAVSAVLVREQEGVKHPGAVVGMVLKLPQGDLLVQAVQCEFKATNNEAAYEALILGLQLAQDLKIRPIQVYRDSQLIVNHVNSSYAAKDPTMMAYLEIAQELKLIFKTFNIKQIPRDQNVEADSLAALGATFKSGKISTIPIVYVLEPAISKAG
ncbi:uncharacterized protein LOC141631131 [Silene latifolia]|uniref:uncharacterized protein LOC141631131 n=1 Tax=Silene latifolia TaxID=37657 RepID=UPI003D77FF3A